VIIIVSIFEYNLSKIQNSYMFKKNFLDKNAPTLQVLTLGSSHALVGINPIFFSMNGFNVADTSQSLYYDYQILNKYADSLENLKVVIIPVSYFSLKYNFSSSVESWRENFYKKVWGLDSENKSSINVRNFSYMALYGQIRSLFYALKFFDVNLASNISKTGWYRLDGKETAPDSGKERVKYHESIMEESSFTENINYLKKMIELAKSKGVTVVLITTPVAPDYFDNVNSKEYNLMQNTIKKITEEYNVKYFNYFLDKNFTPDDFFNSDHLNVEGAEKFSKILNADINKEYK